MSLMRWVRESVADPHQQCFSNINPLHFDNAVFDLFGGLANGATLVPVETTDGSSRHSGSVCFAMAALK